MTRVRRLLAPALALLMPLLGLSTLVLPASATDPDLYPAIPAATCCPEAACDPCPTPDRAPSRSTCRTCDGTVQLAPASRRAELKAPSAVTATHNWLGASPALHESAARLRLLVLAASPPAHILLSTFRN